MPETVQDIHHPTRLPQFLWRLFFAVLIWLSITLIMFIIVAYLAFSVISSAQTVNPDEAFNLALVCAIPSALTVSSLVAIRKLIPMLWQPSQG